MSQIIMPQASPAMEKSTIMRWRKAVGEAIAKGDLLFEAETETEVIAVEAGEAGELGRILVSAGQTVAVGTPVADLLKEGEAAVSAPAELEVSPQSAPAAPAGVKTILMPKAGQSVEEATLIKWRVKPGDVIKKDDVIFEVETDKSVIEVESTEEGRLARIVVPEGAVVPVLVPVAYLAENDADLDAFIAAGGAPSPEPVPAASNNQESDHPQSSILNPQFSPAPAAVADPPRANGHGRVKASPAARKLATELGLDLAVVGEGSGPGGRILSSDLSRVAPAARKAPAKGASDLKPYSPVPFKSATPVRAKMTPMRKAIARNLLASKQNIPHWYIQRVVDADPLLAFYRAEKAKYPCSVNDVLVLAIARTIMEFPEFHSQVDGDEIVELPSVNIGIAVGLDAGLVVPVVLNVEKMDLRALGAESRRLAEAARTTGKVENMGMGCFTISNLGMFGVDQFTAIINPPEAAIMAVGAVREEVIVKDGMMRPGRTLSLTLSADHRIIDGVLAAKFQDRLKEMLENPEVFLN